MFSQYAINYSMQNVYKWNTPLRCWWDQINPKQNHKNKNRHIKLHAKIWSFAMLENCLPKVKFGGLMHSFYIESPLEFGMKSGILTNKVGKQMLILSNRYEWFLLLSGNFASPEITGLSIINCFDHGTIFSLFWRRWFVSREGRTDGRTDASAAAWVCFLCSCLVFILCMVICCCRA